MILTLALCLLDLLVVESQTLAAYHDPNFVGSRTTIVELMEWKWADIATECEVFLGPYGYAGVQTSPVAENAIILNANVQRPWYERYQPASYNLETRSGTEAQFQDMVDRCNRVGVRVYVDVELNHMTYATLTGVGTNGTTFDGTTSSYPGVPYNSDDFHGPASCPTSDLSIQNSQDPIQERNCRLNGLNDLDQGIGYVQNAQAAFLNNLIDAGVAGFRFDASQNMWPANLQSIYALLNNLSTDYFPANSTPFVYHEVVYYGSGTITPAEYLPLGRSLEYRYPQDIGDVFRQNNNQLLKYLQNFGEGWAMLDSDDALVMVDDHDLQRGNIGSFSTNIDFFDPGLLKMSTAFMLAWPYAVPKVMSSYYWPQSIQSGVDVNNWMGPPSDANYNINSVIRNPDLTCGNGWICEHRWRQIYNMAGFRNIAGDEPVANWWDNGANQIAFSRGNTAFIAINNDNYALNNNLMTGLPAGTYCDIISGNLNGMNCTGSSIVVNNDGTANIYVDNNQEDPFIAFHVGSKIELSPPTTMPPQTTMPLQTIMPPQTTIPPQTTNPPQTTSPPLTTMPPQTTSPPQTTMPPQTTSPPQTTMPPQTTSPPLTTMPPQTTSPPLTTIPPQTTSPPLTTMPPQTTSPPLTTMPPQTTSPPQTTMPPQTTSPPQTTMPPQTTSPPQTTMPPQTSTPPQTTTSPLTTIHPTMPTTKTLPPLTTTRTVAPTTTASSLFSWLPKVNATIMGVNFSF